MQVVIRVDSSSQMGSGHLMRCLTLAEELSIEKKATVTFICRDLPDNLSEIVVDKGFGLHLLPYDEGAQKELVDLSEHKRWLGATIDVDRTETLSLLDNFDCVDLLVIDNYALDSSWETPMRRYAKKIMVIDDLADREHDCDILLDHNFYLDMKSRYINLVPKYCQKFIGPSFALISKKFDAVRQHRNNILSKPKFKKALVYIGGADVNSVTLRIIKNIKNSQVLDSIDVVVGASNRDKAAIKALCQINKRLRYHISSDYYYTLLRRCDFCIGAGGVSQLERHYINMPSAVCVAAENQREVVESLEQSQYIIRVADDFLYDCVENDELRYLSTLKVNRFSVGNL